MAPAAYMLDTNVFNDILDGRVVGTLPRGARVVVTHIQRDELLATPNADRRDALLGVFFEVAAQNLAAASMVWDVSNWGEAMWSDGKAYAGVLAALNAEDRRKNNPKDALIAETALAHGFVLVTRDEPLEAAFRKLGGLSIRPEELPGILVGRSTD